MAGDDELFTKIIRLAAPMQDQRDDVGHAATVTHFARILCKKLKADEKIVMPAAILHDIGYYGIPKERLRAMMTNVLNGEVDELKAHHQKRADEVMDVVGSEIMNAYEIAAGMTWDIDCATWEEFPIAQKWFATGEAIAHLRYLESEGRIKRDAKGKIVTFQAIAN